MMTDTKLLLTDLQGLVKYLRTDPLERASEVPEVDRGLREAYVATRQGHRTAQAFEVWRDDYLTQVAVAWVLALVSELLTSEAVPGNHPKSRGAIGVSNARTEE